MGLGRTRWVGLNAGVGLGGRYQAPRAGLSGWGLDMGRGLRDQLYPRREDAPGLGRPAVLWQSLWPSPG